MFDKRLRQIKQNLKKERLDAVFISSVSNISYLSGYANFSRDEREAYLLIGHDFEYIITDGRYSEVIKREVPHLILFERSHKNPTEKLLKSLKSKIKVLGIEEDNLTVGEHKILLKHFKKLKQVNLKEKRSIKEKWEINKIKKATEIAGKAFNYALSKIKIGISEKELAYEIENFMRKNGTEPSFKTIVAFGKNSSIPHHQTGNTILGPESSSGREGQIVLLDMGAKYENYCSDMTRVVFFGKPSEKQKKIYNTVFKAQQKAVDYINKAIKIGKVVKAMEVDKVARKYIKSQNCPDIPHSLGHGVGLEVHEDPHLSPKSKDILKEGMVFSIEPGIYIPDFGGVRIEDLFLLEKNGLKQLTTSPKEIIQL